MGMAASQSRYLGLTARKINVEYEGQQVNQQRTALANQSADLFRDLLSLKVPSPPSQTAYYTDGYAFNDDTSIDGKTKLSSITPNEGSDPPTYTVTMKSKTQVPQYNGQSNQSVSVTGTKPNQKIMLPNGTSFPLSEKIEGMSEADVNEFNKLGKASYQNGTGDTYYSFTNPANNATYYINATQTHFDPAKTTSQNVDLFSKMPVEQEVNKTITNATLSKSKDGLYNNIYWTDEDGNSYNYKLSQSSEYDERGYDDAMQNYNVQNEVYQKQLADINAKTERLQQTDRTLELRLKQLDTEQEALQTEMDSVKKVIDKNIDIVFKTFQ